MSRSSEQDAAENSALLRLLHMSQARYEELLAVPADYALERLGAASVSLSRWERDRGLLRCVVNVGALAPGEERFPTDEVFDLPEHGELLDLSRGLGVGYNRDDPDLPALGVTLLARHGHSAALSVPVHLDSRVWGVLWATKDDGPLSPDALQAASATAEAIAPMIALAERLQTMARLAFEDPLTGLGNRRVLDDTLAELLTSDGPGCTVVVCDVDGLKQVNDQLGHEGGDQVIVAVADAFASAAVQVPGTVAVRLGGDEFAVLIPGEAKTAAIHVVETAAAELRQHDISISCGIAFAPAGTSARDALAEADGAQYGAKRRDALLLVSSGLDPAPSARPRRRISDLRPSAADPATADVQTAVALAVSAVAQGLGQAPADARARLEWLGGHLLEPFDLDHWVVSAVNLDAPARQLVTVSLGMRVERPQAHRGIDLMAEHAFALDDYPLTARAICECGWFALDVADPGADAAERALLESLGKRFVLALGYTEDGHGLLLQLYGNDDDASLDLLGQTLGLAASAALRVTITQLTDEAVKVA